jgi:AraC family transcriptional regulator
MEPRGTNRLAIVLEVMEARLGNAWRVADLAAIAQLSPSRFAHVFRRTVGVPPGVSLRQLRMERARRLLQDAGCPVAG